MNAQKIPISLKKGLKQKYAVLQQSQGNERFKGLKGKLLKQH